MDIHFACQKLIFGIKRLDFFSRSSAPVYPIPRLTAFHFRDPCFLLARNVETRDPALPCRARGCNVPPGLGLESSASALVGSGADSPSLHGLEPEVRPKNCQGSSNSGR